jgi:hypothetical protein
MVSFKLIWFSSEKKENERVKEDRTVNENVGRLRNLVEASRHKWAISKLGHA